MALQPVKRFRAPKYPTVDILAAHPELLRLVPERWRHNAAALAVLGAALTLLSACGRAHGNGTPAKNVKVAPLFIHGAGVGGFGCVAVNPPAILSEMDARAVIRDEAKKAGITFADDAKELPAFSSPLTNVNGFLAPREGLTEAVQPRRTRMRRLMLDGTDARLAVAYEYVSLYDFGAWYDPHVRWKSSATLKDIRGTAQILRDGLALVAPNVAIGVFYDPMADGPAPGVDAGPPVAADADVETLIAGWQREGALKQAHSEELLRQQVRDFVGWLKAQGVI
jgi:hypothetical protein